MKYEISAGEAWMIGCLMALRQIHHSYQVGLLISRQGNGFQRKRILIHHGVLLMQVQQLLDLLLKERFLRNFGNWIVK